MVQVKKNCQSCSMPLSKDPQGGGSEADGRKSLVYCSYCYEKGSFTDIGITVEQMVDKVRGVLKNMGVPKIFVWFLVRRIPHLDRWRTR